MGERGILFTDFFCREVLQYSAGEPSRYGGESLPVEGTGCPVLEREKGWRDVIVVLFGRYTGRTGKAVAPDRIILVSRVGLL